MPSANKMGPVSDRACGRSFMEIRNNKGPRDDPCGTPVTISSSHSSHNELWVLDACKRQIRLMIPYRFLVISATLRLILVSLYRGGHFHT